MKLHRLDPEAAYRGDQLWLPKKRINNVGGMKASLTFPTDPGKAPICAWSETSTHLVVPREFVPVDDYPRLPFEVRNLFPKEFPRVDIGPLTYELRDTIQRIGYVELVESGNGVLSLPCGRGKTVVSIHSIAATQMPALVIMHTEDLMLQWVERFVEHSALKREDVGWIKGDKWDWEKPVAVASIQTLASRWDEVPEEMRRHFGVVVFDEVHHLGAPWFNTVAPLGYGIRWGLSATPFRSDGLDGLYMAHIGPLIYQTLEQEVMPDVFFVPLRYSVSEEDYRKMRDRSGDINTSKMYTWMGEHGVRNNAIMDYIDAAIASGRNCLVLSERVEHLKYMHQHYQGAGLIHGEIKGPERVKALQDHDLVFATTPLAKEGLDRKELDTLFITMPFADEHRFRQIIGRVQRSCEGKDTPAVLIFDDKNLGPAQGMCQKLRMHLTTFKYPYADWQEPG